MFRWHSACDEPGEDMKGGVYLYFGHNILTNGSFEDLDKLGITPKEGMVLTFYDSDADEQDRPIYLYTEGSLYLKGGRWHARFVPDSIRSVLQSEVDLTTASWVSRKA